MNESVMHLRRLATEKTAHARQLGLTGATPRLPPALPLADAGKHTATSGLRSDLLSHAFAERFALMHNCIG